MDNEHIILNSRPISIASYTNYKEAVFLISVLDEPDSKGRTAPKVEIDYIQKKQVKNILTQSLDIQS